MSHYHRANNRIMHCKSISFCLQLHCACFFSRLSRVNLCIMLLSLFHGPFNQHWSLQAFAVLKLQKIKLNSDIKPKSRWKVKSTYCRSKRRRMKKMPEAFFFFFLERMEGYFDCGQTAIKKKKSPYLFSANA